MTDPQTLALVFAAFLFAGFIKGIVGLGLPMISLAILTATIGLKTGIALIVVPAFVTNIWQGAVGGYLLPLLKRLATMAIASCIAIWLATGLLAGADGTFISGVFGLFLAAYSAISLMTPQLPPPGRSEVWMSPFMGAVSGTFFGLMGSYTVPAVLYLQALGLKRDELIQAIGIIFCIVSAMLGLSLGERGLMDWELALASAGAFVPAALGMAAGQVVRKRLNEDLFRKVFFAALFCLGGFIAYRNLVGFA